MSLPTPDRFSDYLVFVDESGDHGLTVVNRDFPLFALAFCVFPKTGYVDEVTPALRRLKLATFGHDLSCCTSTTSARRRGRLRL